MKAFAVVPILALGFLIGCYESPRGIKEGDTQVIAQWLLEKDTEGGVLVGLEDALTRFRMEERIYKACGETCFLDGNDFGSGTYNLFLYTDDISGTVDLLVDLLGKKQVLPGLRIGVAKYTNSERTDWTYEPVFPATLREFKLMHRGEAQ